MFFLSGITTLLQTTWGNRLPLIQGGTFSFLAPAFSIAGMAAVREAGFEVRLQHIQGAVIAGSFFEMLIGYSGLMGKLLRFVGPITIAPTIALIGLALFNLGAPEAGKHWGIGGLTIVLIILFSQYSGAPTERSSCFPSCSRSCCPGVPRACSRPSAVFAEGHPAYVSMDNVRAAPWVRIPYPFQWGMPVFGLAATVGMLAGYLASMVESVGDYYACARLAGAPIPNASVVNRGIGMEGVGCLIAGIFGTGNGTTSYSENIGAIGLTRVGSRRVVQAGAAFMLVLGAFGKFGALFTTIPQPIVGGMYCAMFGMIAAVGLSNLQFVDLNSARNLFILGFAFYMGLSVPHYFAASPVDFGPEWSLVTDVINTLGRTGMAVGAFLAFALDNTIPGTDEERGLTAWNAA